MRMWTKEEREMQSKIIHQWKPWEYSTGAKTEDGKLIIRNNALKHGLRSQKVRLYKKMHKKIINSMFEIESIDRLINEIMDKELSVEDIQMISGKIEAQEKESDEADVLIKKVLHYLKEPA